MNRKIAVSAIVMAFVGGMIFAGTPVEAKKGGGGAIIDEILLAIDALDGRVTTLESNYVEIMRIDGGRITDVHPLEVYFLDGDGLTKNTSSDFELASKISGVDGTITEVRYKVGKSTSDGNQITARLYKNNVEVGSCNLITSTSSHSSCVMNLNELVLKEDLLAMSDITNAGARIFVEGKSAFVAITPSS
jgi:hypothetical protein